MLESEKFAIAAHLHVVLRRVHGRVTDVEWLLKSPEYAREIIKVARSETHADLLKLADKLEAVLFAPTPAARPGVAASSKPAFAPTDPGDSSGFGASGFAPSVAPDAPEVGKPSDGRKRYVGTLR